MVAATYQPRFSSPIMFAAGTRTSSKNVSLNSLAPVICTSGRTLIPGVEVGIMK
ncbi:MAG: hypothetical protein U0360_03780 [Dehalococcoidia bacterium]